MNRLLLLLQAARPAFLTLTALAIALGYITAWHDGVPWRSGLAFLSALAVLLVHTLANVVNDLADAAGSDPLNQDRVAPFTGGSRLLQQGRLNKRDFTVLAWALLVAACLAGVWVIWISGPMLWSVAALGGLLAYGYSMPPLHLQSRGLGEGAVVLAWLGVVVGSDMVLRQAWALLPWVAGVALALQVALVLFVNQFPDVRADALAGKRTLVVRLGPDVARIGYPLLLGVCVGWLSGGVLLGVLPGAALAALAALWPQGRAAMCLLRHAAHPGALRPAIVDTLLGAHVFGLLLLLSLALAGIMHAPVSG